MEVNPAMSNSNYFKQLREMLDGGTLSQRRQGAIREQRVRNGDLRPDQRSLNDGS